MLKEISGSLLLLRVTARIGAPFNLMEGTVSWVVDIQRWGRLGVWDMEAGES